MSSVLPPDYSMSRPTWFARQEFTSLGSSLRRSEDDLIWPLLPRPACIFSAPSSASAARSLSGHPPPGTSRKSSGSSESCGPAESGSDLLARQMNLLLSKSRTLLATAQAWSDAIRYWSVPFRRTRSPRSGGRRVLILVRDCPPSSTGGVYRVGALLRALSR